WRRGRGTRGGRLRSRLFRASAAESRGLSPLPGRRDRRDTASPREEPTSGGLWYPAVADAKRVVGVGVGGTKILAGVGDAEGAIQHRRERLTERESQERLIEELGAAVEDVMDGSIEAIGFGLPSRIDQRTGRVEGSVNIALADVPLRQLMMDRFGLP